MVSIQGSLILQPECRLEGLLKPLTLQTLCHVIIILLCLIH